MAGKPPINQIICGEAKDVLKTLPSEYISCSISSPPYWALRDYGVEGQLGLEPTFEEYISKLCDIYDEVKRVLRNDGTCFVNLGDTYGTSSGTGDRRGSKQYTNRGSCIHEEEGRESVPGYYKSLCLIPQRFAIEMVNRGWILRNIIVWHKPNPMPSSAKDRFTVDYELVMFFVKSKRYWFEPQYEPYQESAIQRMNYPRFSPGSKCDNGPYALQTDGYNHNPLGRNKRCVWTIPTQAYPDAHFATYPENLVEPMIKAGCPEFICSKCGMAREKTYEAKTIRRKRPNAHIKYENGGPCGQPDQTIEGTQRIHIGYTDCSCNAGWRPGIVLDMFRRIRDNFAGGRAA